MKWFLLSALLLSPLTYAAEVTPAVIPRNLHVYSTSGAAYVDAVAYGCSGARYYLNPNHVKYDAIMSILLAAQLANREVLIRFEGCINGSNPQGNIIGVFIK